MNDLKKKVQSQARPTQSFAQLVSKAQTDVLKPYIAREVSNASREVFLSVYRLIVKDKEFMQIRHMALESLLEKLVPGFTKDALANEIAEVEDRLLGLEEVSGAAVEGDVVRLDVSQKQPDSPELGDPDKLVISALLQLNKEGSVQTYVELENAILGMRVGETKTCVVPQSAESGQTEDLTLQLTVKKIARKKAVANV